MTAESSTHTYESGVQETVTLRRGPATPHDCALLKITYSDGEIADCYVNTAWLRDRADQLARQRPEGAEEIERLLAEDLGDFSPPVTPEAIADLLAARGVRATGGN